MNHKGHKGALRGTKVLRLLVGAASVSLLVAGCAKFPGTTAAQNTRLIFTMTVAGRIKNAQDTPVSYVYIVAVNPSLDANPTETGPEPVVAPPWGNGFVAGHATHFVRYDIGQSPHYLVYKFTNPDMTAWGATGSPVLSTEPGPQGATLQFEIDLSQIAPNGVNPQDLQSVQVNFLTMDRVPQGNDSGQKFWDALGNGFDPNSVNDYVRIPLNVSRTYTNADFQNLEPANDVPDPDLDIVAWSVEVRKP